MAQILVVEDDPQIRTMLKRMLEEAGYQVSLAGNGRQAIEIFLLQPADLVITDILMPDKDGLETIREMREAHPKLKMIAISGGGQLPAAIFLKMAQTAGAVTTLNKPFGKRALLEAVQQALGPTKP